MDVLCLIPARGGSKRLPHKNRLPLNGKPLLAHTIEHARASRMVTRTVVSTEDSEIARIAEQYGSEVVRRPLELASDTATSESVLTHVLESAEAKGYSPDLIVFLQCTSPLRESDDVDNAINTLLKTGADSIFSATVNHGLIWRQSDEGPKSLNYDYRDRKRDQEQPREFRENGSIYVFKPWVLKELNNRLGGRIEVYEMPFSNSYQVDSREDFEICELLLKSGRRT